MPDPTTFTLQLNNAPAPQELLDVISQIEVEDDAALASAFRLRVPAGVGEDGDWTWIADDNFKPLTPVSISVRIGSAVNEQLLSGYITAHQVHFEADPGASYFEVVGLDASALMNLEDKVVAWANMADSDIATQIFNAYGFTPQVDGTQPSYDENDVTVIQRGTDLAFLRRLARRNGYEFFVETDAASGITTGHFHKPTLSGQPQKDLALAFGDGTNLRKLDANYDALRPTTADARGVAIGDKSDQSATQSSSSLDPLGATALLDLLDQQPKTILTRASAFDDAELQTRAQAAVDASSWALSLAGEIDVTAYQAILRSRRTVLVKGIGKRYSGTYYVSHVSHSLTRETYTQKFELTRNALGLTGSEPFASGAGISLGAAIG